MTVVALTGGIASGKTTVTDVLQSHGVAVVDADLLARDAVAPGSPGLEAVVARFGSGVLDSSGALDRAELGRIVFADQDAREALNAIVHPEVQRLSQEAFLEHAASKSAVPLVYAVPLLAEAARRDEFDLIVVIHTPRDQRIDRLVRFRDMSQEEATRRVDAQATDDERLGIADVVIDSSGDMDQTVSAAEQLAWWLEETWPDRLNQIPRRLPTGER